MNSGLQFSRYFSITGGILPLLGLLLFCAIDISAQNGSVPPIVRSNSADDKNENNSASIDDMIVKQKISRQKRDYDELLKRGDEALKLSEELESSFDGRDSFSAEDIQRIQAFEKVVTKIRNDLGGDDQDDKVGPVIKVDSNEIDPRTDAGRHCACQ